MHSRIVVCLIVAALCTCATAWEQPRQVSPGDILIVATGDPNDPNVVEDPNATWDPAEHLLARWYYVNVNMSSQVYNPAIRPDLDVQGPQWSMSVVSLVTIVDSNGLIAWSPSPQSIQVFDQDDTLLYSMTPSSSSVRWYQQPASWNAISTLVGTPYLNSFALGIPVDPNVAYPAVFGRIEWSMNVLAGTRTATVEIPFAASDTWVELTPGFEIQVEQATVEEGKYQYRIKTSYDTTKVNYMLGRSIYLWNERSLPPAVVVNLEVLNAEGESIRGLDSGGSFATSGSYTGSGTQMTGTASGSGFCDACGAATTFRYTLAFALQEQEANFVLEDVPVPEF